MSGTSSISSAWSIVLEPHLPLWALAVLAALALLLTSYGIYARAKGAWLRLAFAALVLAALANPVLRREQREPLSDVALLALDRSPSQRLPGRAAALEEAARQLQERLAAMPDLDVQVVELGGDPGGTRLFSKLREAVATIDPGRLAGTIVVTDGQIHDVPTVDADKPGARSPLHALLTGQPGENDRRLEVTQAPGFAMVGEPQQLVVGMDELGLTGMSAPARLTVRRDGRRIAEHNVLPGEKATIPFTLDRAGQTVLEIEVAARDGELTTLNNRVVVPVTGVRDRLRVLLVSGQPYPGLRVWRNLLKADAAVDLVHFTILRPPEKQDGTPIRELALIAFPSRELFEVKLGEFDLVIFDRYNRRGLLPLPYLENVARYVESGGALLEAAGPEFSTPTSLFRTPLSRVLPGRPSGEVFERAFVPTVTELGQRHTVTSGLAADPANPGWGPWYRQVDVEPGDSSVVMTGVADRPLLLLKRVGDGRVAQLLSDHAWLWARGVESGGPQAALLRRLVHWLMKEPELEEEALTATARDDGIEIVRRSLTDAPVEVTVTSPGGTASRVTLQSGADGFARTTIAAEEDGLWQATDGLHTAYAMPRPIAPAELADMRATPDKLQPIVDATGGAMVWLSEAGVPDLRRVDKDRRTAGRGWIGLVRNEAYNVTGAIRTALLPAWLALSLLLATAALAWWREGRS